MPFRQKEFLSRLGFDEANSEAVKLLAKEAQRLKALLPGIQPTYGSVSAFDMMRAICPDDFGKVYARHFWLPSATMHGLQVGMLDAMRVLPDGRLWISNNSLTMSRNENVGVIVDSLLRVLCLTGHHFRIVGTHWAALVQYYNQIVLELVPGTKIIDLPIDASSIIAASAREVPTGGPSTSTVRFTLRKPLEGRASGDDDDGVLTKQITCETGEALAALRDYAKGALQSLLRKVIQSDSAATVVRDLTPDVLVQLSVGLNVVPDDLKAPLDALLASQEGSTDSSVPNAQE